MLNSYGHPDSWFPTRPDSPQQYIGGYSVHRCRSHGDHAGHSLQHDRQRRDLQAFPPQFRQYLRSNHGTPVRCQYSRERLRGSPVRAGQRNSDLENRHARRANWNRISADVHGLRADRPSDRVTLPHFFLYVHLLIPRQNVAMPPNKLHSPCHLEVWRLCHRGQLTNTLRIPSA